MKNIIIIKYFLLSALFYACDSPNKGLSESFLLTDSSDNNIIVPQAFTNANDKGFTFHADTIYLNNINYCGWVYKLNEHMDTIFLGGYFNGIEEGVQKKWYANKQIAELRLFHLGKKIGKHIGFWENGNPKFEFYFSNGEHQGIAKEWYKNDAVMNHSVAEWISWLSGAKILKALATGYNPAFVLTNIPRDLGLIWLSTNEYSAHLPLVPFQMLKDMATVFSDVIMNKGRVKDFIKEGGSFGFLTHYGKMGGETFKIGGFEGITDNLS